MKAFITEFLKILGIMTIVAIAWQSLEQALTGQINVSSTDNIIWILFSGSLYYNLKKWDKIDA